MANRYWRSAVSGLWSSTANWSTTSGGSSGASIPSSLDDVFFDRTGTYTISLSNTVGHNAGSITISGGVNLTFTSSTTTARFLRIYRNVTNNGSLTFTDSTRITFTGNQASNVSFGTHQLHFVSISKTSATTEFNQNSAMNVNRIGSSTLVFVGGTWNMNGSVTCGTFNNANTTARKWAMNADMTVTSAGSPTSQSTVSCTILSRTGRIYVNGGSGTVNVGFGSSTISTAARDASPNVTLRNGYNYNPVGGVYDLRLEARFSSGTMVVFNEYEGGATASSAGSIRLVGLSQGSRIWDSDNSFGTIYMSGSSSGFGVNYARCATLNLEATSSDFSVYDLTMTNAGTGLDCTVGGNTYRLYGPIRGGSGISLGGSSTSVFNLYDIDLTSSSTNAFISHTFGTLNLFQDIYCRSFSSNSGSTRTINFQYSYIEVRGTGSASLTHSLFTTDVYLNDAGGIRINSTGANTFGTTSQTPNNSIIVELVTVGGSMSGTVRRLVINDGCRFSSASTVGLNSDTELITGSSPGSLTNLTVSLDHPAGSYTWNFGFAIAALESTIADSEWFIDYARITSGSFTGLRSTYNYGDVELQGTGTVTMGGNSATVHKLFYFRTLTSAGNISFSTGRCIIEWYENNIGGTFTLNSGILQLNWDLTVRSFSSGGSTTRSIEFLGSRIRTQNFGGAAGGTSFNSTGLTTDYETNYGGGVITGGTGLHDFPVWSTLTGSVFDCWHQSSCTFTGRVRNFRINEEGANQAAAPTSSTISVFQDVTGDTGSGNNFTGLNIAFVSPTGTNGVSGYINLGGDQGIGTISGSIAGQSVYVDNVRCTNMTWSGTGAYYAVNFVNNVVNTTCSGAGASTYDINYLRGTNITLSAGTTGGASTYNLNNVEVTGTSINTGLWFSGSGTLNVNGLVVTGSYTNQTSNTRTVNFGSNFIKTTGTGQWAGGTVTGLTQTCSTGGGWHDGTGQWDTGPVSGSNSINFIVTRGCTWSNISSNRPVVKSLKNHTDSAFESYGYPTNSTVFTVFLYGGLDIANGTPFVVDASVNYSRMLIQMNYSGGGTVNWRTGIDFGYGIAAVRTSAVTFDMNGTVQLNGNVYTSNVFYNTGNLNLNGYEWNVGTGFNFNVTNNANTKNINFASGGNIRLEGTAGNPFNCVNTSANGLQCSGTGYIILRGGNINIGSSSRSDTNQPNIDMYSYASGVAYTIETGGFSANNCKFYWNGSSVHNGGTSGIVNVSGNLEVYLAAVYNYGFIMRGTSAATYTQDTTSVRVDNITVSGGKFFTLASAARFYNCTISSGNTLQTSGQTLNIDHTLTIGGTLTLGASTVNMTGSLATSGLTMSSGSTLNGGTSEIVFSQNNTDMVLTLQANQVLPTVTRAGTFNHTGSGEGTGWLSITAGSNAEITTLRNTVSPAGIKIASGTLVVPTFNVSGTAGNLVYVQGNMSKPGTTGLVERDYLGVKNSSVSGGAPPGWYAGNNSTNFGGNTGWIFGSSIAAAKSEFFMFF